MITTNLTYSEWDKVFLNPITTAAAVDRIIHNCETLNIEGKESWRTESAKAKSKQSKEESSTKGSSLEIPTFGEGTRQLSTKFIQSSRQWELPPLPLTDTYVTVSRHTAPNICEVPLL